MTQALNEIVLGMSLRSSEKYEREGTDIAPEKNTFQLIRVLYLDFRDYDMKRDGFSRD